MTETNSVDVVVVGGGLSGLAAAQRLVDGGVRSVAVLDAKARVGGRTATSYADDVPLDEGATLVYPMHHNVIRLAQRYGIELFRNGADGRFLYYANGTGHAFDFGGVRGTKLLGARALQPLLQVALRVAARWLDLPMKPDALLELLRAIGELDRLAATVPATAPWTAPGAVELDHRTLGNWLDETLQTDQAKRLIESALTGYLPRSASMLYTLHFLNTWGGVGQLMGGPKEILRFAHGAQELPDALAAALGDRVFPDTPVEEIEWSPDKVRVHSATTHFEADRVIVAVTPSGQRAIRFRPELPTERDILQQAWRPVYGTKINVVYPDRFWQRAGLSGAALSDLDVASNTLDASPRDGRRGILASYLEFDPEAPQQDSPQRRQALLSDYAEMFGPAALEPQHYFEKNWYDEPYTFGCEGGLTTGALTAARVLPKHPVGRLHWAGVETADTWMGFLDGAIQAGERCAEEILVAHRSRA